MKTITEFNVINLKNAGQTKQELTASGKTPEELPQAMGEALKVEGDKLTHLLNALEIVGTKVNDLKRVVVFSLGESEPLPSGAEKRGEHCYKAEYYPPIESKRAGGRPGGKPEGKGRRGDKRGGGRKDKNRRPPRKDGHKANATPSA